MKKNKRPEPRSDARADIWGMVIFVGIAALVAHGLPDLANWIAPMVCPIWPHNAC